VKVLPPYIFPNIDWFRVCLRYGFDTIEHHESFIKQSSRTRYDVVGAQGILRLSIPTVKKSRNSYLSLEIDYGHDWQKLHWRSLTSCYNHSPFFMYYENELEAILKGSYGKMHEFQQQSMVWILEKLALDLPTKYTNAFAGSENSMEQNKDVLLETPLVYPQVFEDRIGFVPNCSILDLLFNKGPEASYLLATSSSE
jgi:hypothetical protein